MECFIRDVTNVDEGPPRALVLGVSWEEEGDGVREVGDFMGRDTGIRDTMVHTLTRFLHRPTEILCPEALRPSFLS